MASAQFLNVDLDLRDEKGIAALLRELGRKVFVLHDDGVFASLELATGTTPPLDVVLSGLLDLVEGLSPRGRSLWRRCTLRRMSIGIEAGNEHAASGFVIPLVTMKRLTAIETEIEFTVYAVDAGRKPPARLPVRRPAKTRS